MALQLCQCFFASSVLRCLATPLLVSFDGVACLFRLFIDWYLCEERANDLKAFLEATFPGAGVVLCDALVFVGRHPGTGDPQLPELSGLYVPIVAR